MTWVKLPFRVPISNLVSLLITLVILIGIISNFSQVGDDPYRCKALLHEGSWLDRPAKGGVRDRFTRWQPRGCMMHEYSKEDIQECMEGRHMVFFGDSTSRQVFWAMARLVRGSTPSDGRGLLANCVFFSWTGRRQKKRRKSHACMNPKIWRLAELSCAGAGRL